MARAQTASERNAPRRSWHAVPATETLELLKTDPDAGLDDEEADARRRRFGENKLTPRSRRTVLRRLASQFNDLFIYLLMVAAVVAGTLGQWLDSGVIFAVVLVIAVVGFVQEGRAERALESVRRMLSDTARVLRRGARREIPAAALSPGDIVLLEAGDLVPADLRLLRARNLQMQEAALTGESTAVEKRTEPVAERTEIGDRQSMAFSGTLVTAGRGRGVVVAIGDDTELGRISGMLSEVESLKTPLTRRLDAFTKGLTVAIIALAAVTLAVGVFVWERGWGEMLLAAVTVAVAAVPEGLPAVMTVTLAIGVQRMAQRNAIIRRLPAVETLGSVTVICSDKTGTLTRNEMTAKTLRTADEDIEVEGTGYLPEGGFRIGGSAVDPAKHPTALEMVRAGLLCNDAALELGADPPRPEGDPTEVALIVLAHKAGFDVEREREARPRLDAIPFASERRYMATLNRNGNGADIHVKGAPERVLEMCSDERRDGGTADLARGAWAERIDRIAARGQRVLAVARKDASADTDSLEEDDVEHGLTLLGLFGLIDPPRRAAIDAVATCLDAGIRVKMITGDHKLTAKAIAGELGLEHPERALTGRELSEIDDETLRRTALDVDVFARTSPEHKLRLVKALQAERQVTAMTGDGVNDAPAIKRADIGIAMGRKGTDAAREASEMVLADDDFASIEQAIEEGRTVYDNLKKAILFLLPTSAAEALTIVIAILVGLALPITPVQILWINMITAVTLGIALAWERAEGDLMQRPPRPFDEPLLTPYMAWRVGYVSVLLLLGVGLLFLQEQNRGAPLELARTVAVNTLVLGEIFYLLNTRFLSAPAYTLEGLLGSRATVLAVGVCLALQLLFTYAPFMNVLFATVPLDVEAWARCIAVGVAVFAVVELEKLIVRRRSAARGNGSEPVGRRGALKEEPR